jgi:hypothetical protein
MYARASLNGVCEALSIGLGRLLESGLSIVVFQSNHFHRVFESIISIVLLESSSFDRVCKVSFFWTFEGAINRPVKGLPVGL